MKMKKSLLVSVGVFVIALAIVFSLDSSPAVGATGSATMTVLTQTELAEWFGGTTDENCDRNTCTGTDSTCTLFHSLCTSAGEGCGTATTYHPGKKCGTANKNMICTEPSQLCMALTRCWCLDENWCSPLGPLPPVNKNQCQ